MFTLECATRLINGKTAFHSSRSFDTVEAAKAAVPANCVFAEVWDDSGEGELVTEFVNGEWQ